MYRTVINVLTFFLLSDRESMETLLREHAFRYSPFRSLMTGELPPEQYAMAAGEDYSISDDFGIRELENSCVKESLNTLCRDVVIRSNKHKSLIKVI